MSDITLTNRGYMTDVQANTDAAVEFVDAYTALELEAVDSGRIFLPESGVWAFTQRALLDGLTVDRDATMP